MTSQHTSTILKKLISDKCLSLNYRRFSFKSSAFLNNYFN